MNILHHIWRVLIRYDFVRRLIWSFYYLLLDAISIIAIVYICALLTYWVVFSRPPDFY